MSALSLEVDCFKPGLFGGRESYGGEMEKETQRCKIEQSQCRQHPGNLGAGLGDLDWYVERVLLGEKIDWVKEMACNTSRSR